MLIPNTVFSIQKKVIFIIWFFSRLYTPDYYFFFIVFKTMVVMRFFRVFSYFFPSFLHDIEAGKEKQLAFSLDFSCASKSYNTQLPRSAFATFAVVFNAADDLFAFLRHFYTRLNLSLFLNRSRSTGTFTLNMCNICLNRRNVDYSIIWKR